MEKYCTECGEHLIRIPKPAHKIIIEVFDPIHGGAYLLGTKYNEKTGKRQFGIIEKCPNKKWYNNCTELIDEKSLHDSDLPELLNL